MEVSSDWLKSADLIEGSTDLIEGRQFHWSKSTGRYEGINRKWVPIGREVYKKPHRIMLRHYSLYNHRANTIYMQKYTPFKDTVIMNAAANVIPITAVSQASSTASKSPVLKSPIDATSLDEEVQALLAALRPTVIVSPQSISKPDVVNVTPNTDAVQALNTVQGMEIDVLIYTLLKAEADDFKRQIAAQ